MLSEEGAFIWHIKNINWHFRVYTKSFWFSLCILYSQLLMTLLCANVFTEDLKRLLIWFILVIGNKASDLLVRAAKQMWCIPNTCPKRESWRTKNRVSWTAGVSYHCSWNSFLPSVTHGFIVYIILPSVPRILSLT